LRLNVQPARFRRAALTALLAGSLASLACGDDDDDATGAAGSSASSNGGSAAAGAANPAGAGNPGEGGSATEQPGGGGSDSGIPHFPCEVEDVIVAKCQRCHGDPPENDAPFPLLTWDDTRRPYGALLVYEAMLPAIETDFMPLTQLELEPPVEPLTPQEKTLLLDWLEDEAPPVLDADCH
jgi:hypothetical protein